MRENSSLTKTAAAEIAGKTKTAGALTENCGKTKKGAVSPLASLLKKISALKGRFWVRLLYIHPDHFNPDILDILKKDARILPYFDIPFQSGDDGVIRAMNRKNSAVYYKKLVKTIRAQFNDAALRTTFLAGFPGETDEAAANTLDFLQAIEPDWSGAFAYSKEEDTAAFKMKGQVPKKTAAARVAALQNAQEKITRERLASRVRQGKKLLEYDVLVEELVADPRAESSQDQNGADKKSLKNQNAAAANKDISQDQEGAASYAIGRAWFQAPEVDGNIVIQFDPDSKDAALVQPGAVVRVRALAVSGVDIYAELIG